MPAEIIAETWAMPQRGVSLRRGEQVLLLVSVLPFGRDLRLIGGVDLDVLLQSKRDITREIESKVPPLLQRGGYIPVVDGRVRANVPLENYLHYRQVLQQVTHAVG